MSVAAHRYVTAVLDDGAPDLRAVDRQVFREMADWASVDGISWPSVDTMATRTALHPGTVRKARARLVAAGYITAVLSKGHETNRYRFPVQAFVSSSTTRFQGAGSDRANPRPGRANPRLRRVNPRPGRAEPIEEPCTNPPQWHVAGVSLREWVAEQVATS